MSYQITWLGHATFILDTPGGKRILVDPWFGDNPSVPDAWKSIDALGKVDILLISHGHFDHVGEIKEIVDKYQPTTICIFELGQWLGSQGIEGASPMNVGGSQQVDGVTLTMVPAVHTTGIPDPDGTLRYGGTATGYIILLEDGRRIYYTGDTAATMDMKLYGDIYEPELVIMPIGDFYTMGPEGAAISAEMIGADRVLPVHWGTFPALTGTPERLRELLEGTDIEVLDCKPGEVISG